MDKDQTIQSAIVCGSNLELLQTVPRGSIDLIITEVPLLARFPLQVLSSMHRCLKADAFCVSFYNWAYADEVLLAAKRSGFRVVSHLVWHRSRGTEGPYAQGFHEVAFLFTKGRPPKPTNPIRDVIEWSDESSTLSVRDKPVGALIPLVRAFSKPGAVVLDPFATEGSVLVAAKVCGRRYLGFEIDKDRADLTRRRLAHASSSFRKDARKNP